MRENLGSVSHRCHLFEVAFVWELTKETIHLPLGCLQGGLSRNAWRRCGAWQLPVDDGKLVVHRLVTCAFGKGSGW